VTKTTCGHKPLKSRKVLGLRAQGRPASLAGRCRQEGGRARVLSLLPAPDAPRCVYASLPYAGYVPARVQGIRAGQG